MIELQPPKQWHPSCIGMWLVKKSDALFLEDVYGRMHKADLETGIDGGCDKDVSRLLRV